MPLEINPNYPSDLDETSPVNGDPKSEGDDQFRNIKRVLKNTLPNVTGAITVTHTQINSIPNLAPKASPALTGIPTAPTAAAGTSTTQIATTAFVAGEAFASALPAQAGNGGKFVTTDGTTASWASLPSPPAVLAFPIFGDGSDGNVVINSGTTTLTRNMFYNDLTISGSGSLDAAGWQVFVKGTLDLSAAPAGAIKRTPIAGSNAIAQNGGVAPAAMAEFTAGGAGLGLAGKTATSGAGAASTQAVKTNVMLGGLSGATKTAGSAGGGATAAGAGAAKPAAVQSLVTPAMVQAALAGAALAQGGVGGAGGPSGAGGTGGTTFGGAGGAGGDGGGVLDIRANIISRGAGTAAGAISAVGGRGGDASAPGATNGGGGSGGAGGGGGFVQVAYAALTGATATNCVDVSGGRGGDGSALTGGGTTNGQGADGGDGGRFRVFNLTDGTFTENASAVTGTANSGLTGGAGAVARYNL